jgi:hypothetical protein
MENHIKPRQTSWKNWFIENFNVRALVLFAEYKSNKERETHKQDLLGRLTSNTMKIDCFDATEALPDAKFLAQFDCILLVSMNAFFYKPEQLGDLVVRKQKKKKNKYENKYFKFPNTEKYVELFIVLCLRFIFFCFSLF